MSTTTPEPSSGYPEALVRKRDRPPGVNLKNPTRWWQWPGQVLTWLGMAAVAAMLFHVVAEVAARGALNSPLTGTLEITTYWYLGGIAFIGLWQAFVHNEHISVDLATARLQPGAQWVAYLFGAVITFIFLALVLWFSVEAAFEAMDKGEYIGADRVPVWPMRFVVPLGVGAFMLSLIAQVTRVVRDGNLTSLEDHHEPV
ncbi:TRAP transporter small permease [Citricoccus sp. NPDC055426]|uniref:TRAP transporter small permease n=1 Tax=Citricoccus sp. NPDC055426 TaxID=3155536 RepID=UPI00341A37B5